MKKFIVYPVFFLLILSINTCSSNKKFIKPGEKFNNGTQNTIFLVALKPGQTFKNTSQDTFKVLKTLQDVLEFNKQLKIDFMIKSHQVELDSNKLELDKLNKRLDSKLKNIEKQ